MSINLVVNCCCLRAPSEFLWFDGFQIQGEKRLARLRVVVWDYAAIYRPHCTHPAFRANTEDGYHGLGAILGDCLR